MRWPWIAGIFVAGLLFYALGWRSASPERAPRRPAEPILTQDLRRLKERREREIRREPGSQAVQPPVGKLEDLPGAAPRPGRALAADEGELAQERATDADRDGAAPVVIDGVGAGRPAQLSLDAPIKTGRGAGRRGR